MLLYNTFTFAIPALFFQAHLHISKSNIKASFHLLLGVCAFTNKKGPLAAKSCLKSSLKVGSIHSSFNVKGREREIVSPFINCRFEGRGARGRREQGLDHGQGLGVPQLGPRRRKWIEGRSIGRGSFAENATFVSGSHR